MSEACRRDHAGIGILTFEGRPKRRARRAAPPSRVWSPRQRENNDDNKMIELNETNFDQEVLNATQPVLVEFWAGWSAPCTAMAPMLALVAGPGPNSVKVGRVNVECHEDLTEHYGVRSVPTLLIFNQGGLKDRIVGRTTEETVRDKIRRLTSLSTGRLATQT